MFFELGIKDIIDILLVAGLLYYIYRLMRESRSLNTFFGVLMFIILWLFVSQVLGMRLLGSILDKLVSVGVLVLVILFQDEIRRFLFNMGANNHLSKIVSLFQSRRGGKNERARLLPLVMACMNMSKQKVGALIVIEHTIPLDDIIRTGDVIDAAINQRLIENLFFKNSPLHDGAVILRGGRIEAAGCILPVSHSIHIPKELGLRHRAAMGIAQETDATAIIVSEETGAISVAEKGQYHLRLSAEELENLLSER